MSQSRHNLFGRSTKRSASPSFDAKPEPSKHQRVRTPEEIINPLYLYANNSKLRAEYAQEINEFLSSAYQGSLSPAEQGRVVLPDRVRELFKKRDTCKERLQAAITQACNVLGEQKSKDKSPSELLDLLKQECASKKIESIEDDLLEEEEGQKQELLNQAEQADVLENALEQHAHNLSTAIEKKRSIIY